MNNDDMNDEFAAGPENDIDNDFGEFDQETERGSLGDLVKKNPAIKIGLIVAALLVVVGGIALFGGSKKKGPDSTVSQAPDVKETPGTTTLSPQMKEVMEEANQQRLEEAQKNGGSVIPQPIDASKQVLTVPADETPTEDPLLRWRQMQDERLKAQQAEQSAQQQKQNDPSKDQALQALATAMSAQMAQILGGKKIDNLKSMEVTNLQALIAAQQAQAAKQGQQTTTTGATTQVNGQNALIDPTTGLPYPPAKILLPAGAIEYSQLLVEANSDVPGPVVALIVSGPFAGSRVLGTFSKQNDEYLVIQFQTLVNKKGISVPIQAYALDPDTTLSGLATDIDHKYWERVILPAAAEFIQGMGQAYSDQQGQTTVVTGDVVVQDKPPLNTKEQVAAGVQKAADKVGDILDDEGSKTQVMVRVRAGTPMGILFMNPITDQDFLVGKNSPSTTRIQQQQQQQQTLLQQQQNGNNGQSPMYLIQGLQNAQNLQASGANAGTTTGLPATVTPTNGTSLPAGITSTRQ
jgi:intracellular multiplication protein IcmE